MLWRALRSFGVKAGLLWVFAGYVVSLLWYGMLLLLLWTPALDANMVVGEGEESTCSNIGTPISGHTVLGPRAHGRPVRKVE